MTTLTLYDVATGEPVGANEPGFPGPVVDADDPEAITFAFDPILDRALVQFAVTPDDERLVAAVQLGTGDDLQEVHRAVRERIDGTDQRVAAPGEVPPHLHVFHYLAHPNPTRPDAETRQRLLNADESIGVEVATAVDAVGIVAYVRERVPWKVVAVCGPDDPVDSVSAGVVVVVTGDSKGDAGRTHATAGADEPTTSGVSDDSGAADVSDDSAGSVDGGGSDEAAVFEDLDGVDVGAVSDDLDEFDDESVYEGLDEFDDEAVYEGLDGFDDGGSDRADRPGPTDPREQPDSDGDPAVLRIYDGSSGVLAYDSRQSGDPPSTESDAAVRADRDGLALSISPETGTVRTVMQASGDGISARFVAEYERAGTRDELLASFARELEERVDDLGVQFFADVADDTVEFDRLTREDPAPPAELSEAALAVFDHLDDPVDPPDDPVDRLDEPLDFVAPSGAAAFELVAFLDRHLAPDRSVAVCEAGRTDDLASTDVVVTVDSTRDEIGPSESTAERLAEVRLQERLQDARNALGTVVDGVDEVTGTPAARQRVFAATTSGPAFTERGLSIVPTEDRRPELRRRQASSLTLYGLLTACSVAVVLGEYFAGTAFDVAVVGLTLGLEVTGTTSLLGSHRIDPALLAGTPLAVPHQPYVLEGGLILAGGLLVIVLGSFLLFGLQLPSRAAVASRRRRFSLGLGAGPVLSTVRPAVEEVRAAVEDIEEEYHRLEGREGTSVEGADDFGAFLEQQLFAGAATPSVAVVSRRERRRQLLGGMLAGALGGGIVGGVFLGALWIPMVYDPAYAPVVLGVLVVFAGLVAVASIARTLVVAGRATRRTVHDAISSSRGY